MKQLGAPKTDYHTRQKLAKKWGCPPDIISDIKHSAAMNIWLHNYIEKYARPNDDNIRPRSGTRPGTRRMGASLRRNRARPISRISPEVSNPT
jgi:hypothetical protein